MKKKNALLTNTAKRIIAAAMAFAMLPSVLSYELVYAASGDGEATDITSEVVPEPTEDESEGITVWKDGKMQKVEAVTGDDWVENDVSGGDSPTSAALSVDEYTQDQYAIPVDSSENLYSLTAATGISAGTSVEYFAIRYTVGEGENAVAQTKYIFPKIHSLEATRDYINNQKGTVTNKNVWYATTFKGYYSIGQRTAVQSYSQTISTRSESDLEAARKEFLKTLTSNGKFTGSITSETKLYRDESKKVSLTAEGTFAKRHNYLAEMNYKINENALTENALSSWGVDEFLFKTEAPITSVTGVEVFMSNGKWTVQGLSVSKVNKIGGYNEYGYYSGKYFLSLEKEIICQLTKKKSGTLTLSANGDTLVNVGGDDSVYFALTKPEKPVSTSTGFKDLYSICMNFADTTDAGIESLLRNDSAVSAPDAGSIAEDLAVEIKYKDINGWTRNVTMPVLLSVLGQYKESGVSVNTIGLAQRGDELAFTACLPDFASIITTRVYVAKAARDILASNCGIGFVNSKKIDSSLIAALDKDRIALSGFSVYQGTCRMSNTQDGKLGDKTLKSYSYAFAYSSKSPSFYYTNSQKNGYIINANTSDTFSLAKYKDGDPVIASGYTGNFLIRLKTSDIKGSETTGVIKAKIYYQDSNGNVKASQEYNVKDQVQNYLGYWPSKFKTLDNFGYTYGLSLGNYVEFPVDLPDAAAVTSVEVSLDEFADEWQLASISVAVLDGIGKRRAYAQDLKAGTDSSPYRFTRPVIKTVVPPFPIDVSLLFTPGENYSINTGAGTVIKAEEIDFNTVKNRMTYEQTQWNLGYVKTRKTYDIDVKVADDPDSANANGDSGSTNQFYFQLMFKNGRSGFVLANQQLSSDGFRAGQHENFEIQVNRDYGELQSIRIIPEDVSEDSEIFDKLNIEEITVAEQTGGGAGMEYVFDNVGWIDIDYYDKSEEKSTLGRKGRSINSLAKKFRVSKKRSVIYLLCEVTADPWPVNNYPFEASVSCTIDYIDTSNQPQSKSFDVAKRMYEYMNKTPKVYSSSYDGSDASLYSNMGTVTDTNWMLRPCHTDRFILPPLADVKMISSMTFYATNRGKGTGYWVISGLSLSRILSDTGNVSISKYEEYYRDMDIETHCQMVSSYPLTMTLPAGAMQKQKIKLTEKEITWNENKTWISAVERTPTSSNDTLNIYVYPTETSNQINDTSLSIAAQYTAPGAKVMQVKQSAMKIYGSGTEDAMYYYTGLSAPDMQSLSSLWLSCRSTKVVFDHAIVEQVRDDVIVSRYTINLGGSSAMLGLRASPSNSNSEFAKNKQVLSLSFGDKTADSHLIAPNDDNSNVNDIAVAIKYRSTLDHGENEYTSEYVYLGDTGLKKLSPGLVVDIPFSVPNVSEITGYKIGMFGSVKADVRGALAFNYSYSDVEIDEETSQIQTTGDKLLNVYSCDSRIDEVPNYVTEKKMTKTGMLGEGGVAPLELNIKTADAEGKTETGNNSVIAAKIYYKDHNKAEQVVEIEDLKTYIQADADHKKFLTGQTATVKMFIPDCEEVTAIELKPSEGTWKIERIDGWLMLDKEINRVVNDEFTTDGQKLSLKTVKLVTYVTKDNKYMGTVTKHRMAFTMDGGKPVTVQVSVEGGYDMQIQSIVNNEPADMPEETYAVSGNKFSFYVPVNNGAVPLTYTITVTAKENINTQDVIVINVPVPEKEEEEKTESEGEGKDDPSSTDDSSTAQQTDDSSSGSSESKPDESYTDESSSADSGKESGAADESSKADESSSKTDESQSNKESQQDSSEES